MSDEFLLTPAQLAACREVDALAAGIIAAHTAHYHPGRDCRENEHGKCVDAFGVHRCRNCREAVGYCVCCPDCGPIRDCTCPNPREDQP